MGDVWGVLGYCQRHLKEIFNSLGPPVTVTRVFRLKGQFIAPAKWWNLQRRGGRGGRCQMISSRPEPGDVAYDWTESELWSTRSLQRHLPS
jgi:hypothetical protein